MKPFLDAIEIFTDEKKVITGPHSLDEASFEEVMGLKHLFELIETAVAKTIAYLDAEMSVKLQEEF